MIAALILAAVCTPDAAFSPTPTIKGDHDRERTAKFRVYAQRPGDASWPWIYDIPYLLDPDYGEFGQPITLDWPIQRVVPSTVQREQVRVMVKAVNEYNVESAPSGILTICMPPICASPGPCN